jgi:hypothetical protein
MKRQKKRVVPTAEAALKRHFRTHRLHDLVTANRTFPMTARVDLQLALERLFSSYEEARLLGIRHPYSSHETLNFALVLGDQHNPVVISPLQHEEVDIGEALPARCLRQAIWRALESRPPVGLLISTAMRRAAQLYIENGSSSQIRTADEALEEMLFAGGSLNTKLLGAEGLNPVAAH